jgi:hypothetical protein
LVWNIGFAPKRRGSGHSFDIGNLSELRLLMDIPLFSLFVDGKECESVRSDGQVIPRVL